MASLCCLLLTSLGCCLFVGTMFIDSFVFVFIFYCRVLAILFDFFYSEIQSSSDLLPPVGLLLLKSVCVRVCSLCIRRIVYTSSSRLFLLPGVVKSLRSSFSNGVLIKAQSLANKMAVKLSDSAAVTSPSCRRVAPHRAADWI